MNQADTAWMLVSTALVLLMTPALAFFYGGLVRSKNALNTMMMSFISLGFVGVMWAVVGYSLAFAPGNAWVGDTSRLFLTGVGLEASSTALIPHMLFMSYQGTFAIITAALISGAIVERMRFSAYVTFITLWALVVYCPDRALGVGRRLVVQDGRARLRRRHRRARERGHRRAGGGGRGRQAPRLSRRRPPAAQRAVHAARRRRCCGSAGSASTRAARVAANGIAALAFTTTMLAPAAHAGGLDDARRHARSGSRPRSGAATAIVVGLVAITPAAGFVGPMSAIALGGIAAVPELLRPASWRAKTSLDDSLDVVAAHGVGGTVGALLTGVFAQKALNGVADGLLLRQSGAARRSRPSPSPRRIVYSGVMSFVLLKLIGLVMPLRAESGRRDRRAWTSRSTAKRPTCMLEISGLEVGAGPPGCRHRATACRARSTRGDAGD